MSNSDEQPNIPPSSSFSASAEHPSAPPPTFAAAPPPPQPPFAMPAPLPQPHHAINMNMMMVPVAVPPPAAAAAAPLGVWEQVQESSIWLKLFAGLMLLMWGFFFLSSPIMGLIMPFIFVPTFVLFWRWTKLHTRVDFKNCANNYALALVPGTFVVLIAEFIITALIAFVCFSDQMSHVKKCLADQTCALDGTKPFPVEKTLGFYVFVFLLSFVTAGGCEETLKYLCMRRAMKDRGVPHLYTSHVGVLMFVLCAALGFSTIENVGYVSTSVFSPNAQAGDIILNLLGRIFISTPLHLLVAALLAIQAIRRDIQGAPLKIWHVMGPSVFFHGGFDFVLFLLNTSNLPDVTQYVLMIVFVVVWMILLVAVIMWMIKKYDIHFWSPQPQNAPPADNQDDAVQNRNGFQLLPNQDDEPQVNNNNNNYAINMVNLQPQQQQQQQQLQNQSVVSANAIAQPVPVAMPLTQQQWAQYWHSLPPQHQAYLLQQYRAQQPQV